jgi:hypothetical protein
VEVDVLRLLHNPSLPAQIEIDFTFSDTEKKTIRTTCKDWIYRRLWAREHNVPRDEERDLSVAIVESDTDEALSQRADTLAHKIDTELQEAHIRAEVRIGSDARIHVEPCRTLNYVFSYFNPTEIGIIGYHGPHRDYGREHVGGINIGAESASSQLATSALFNQQQRYGGIKQELASNYIRSFIAKATGVSRADQFSLQETIRGMFSLFIPGKMFAGPVPRADGKLEFPVVLGHGAQHDVDDLSSGEKDLVYGYLRLANLAPKNSIMLLDGPELHLNPRLVRKLPDFYRRHLGAALGNQLWMVTHSDALLWQAIRSEEFR